MFGMFHRHWILSENNSKHTALQSHTTSDETFMLIWQAEHVPCCNMEVIDNGLHSLANLDAEHNARSYTVKKCVKLHTQNCEAVKMNRVIAIN